MARSNTPTLLALDRFASIAGIHPLHFNQVELHDLAPAGTCGDPWVQHSWQAADRVGREEIAQAIGMAETNIANHLGFWPAPRWVRDEPIAGLRGIRAEYPHSGFNVRGVLPVYKTQWGHVISGGAETWTLVAQGAAVAYTDVDGDGYKETATITVPVTFTDESEVSVVYPGVLTDQLPEWRIRPRRAVIAGGTATIVVRREQLVVPTILESLQANAADGSNDAHFLTTVDVYRRWNDPSTMATLLYTDPTCLVPPAQFEAQTGAVAVSNPVQGLITIEAANWNVTTEEWERIVYCGPPSPDRVLLNYRSGWRWRGSLTDMDPIWERAIAYYALGLLDRPLCNCDQLRTFTEHWAQDLAETTPGGSSWRTTREQLNNPLGTTRGAVYAWNLVKEHMLAGAVWNA